MENQHRKIAGYRELSQDEIDLMNEIKVKGAELGTLVAKLEAAQTAEADHLTAAIKSDEPGWTQTLEAHGEARRWTAIGKTQVQQGLMALTRAVARPNFF